VTDPASGRRLLVDADLELSIDGVDATLVGRDSHLTLRTDHPVRLWRALRRSGLPGALHQLEQQVDAPGMYAPALTVEGPHGPVAGIGSGVQRGAGGASPAGTELQWYRPQNLVPPAAAWAAAAVGLAIAVSILWSRRR
jgi:hypothetical protein